MFSQYPVRTLCHQISVLSEELRFEGNPPSQWSAGVTVYQPICSTGSGVDCFGAVQISCCLFWAMDQWLEYVYILSDSLTAWRSAWATDSTHSSHVSWSPGPTAQRDHRLSLGKDSRRVRGMKLGWEFIRYIKRYCCKKGNSVPYFHLLQEYSNCKVLFVLFPLITSKEIWGDRRLHLIMLMGISRANLKKSGHSLLLISNMFLKRNLRKMFWTCFGLFSSKQTNITMMATEWTYTVQIGATFETLIHQCTPNPP